MLPKKIYKYESFSAQALINLKAGELYFSLPSQFNDPFDCTLPISYDLGFDDVGKLRFMFPSDLDIPDMRKEQLDGMSDADFYEMIISILNRNISSTLEGKGISCFSSCRDNMLMWSHYGQKHTGFCLEFDTKFAPFNKAKEVNYVREFPKLNVEDLLTNLKFDSIISLLHTKSLDWEYEKEWRCIHVESPKIYGYEQKSLTGVYFGSEMDLCAIEIICLVLQGQNPAVKFWRGEKCSDSFGVKFEEFSYSSHLSKQA
jgi:hypothetical protein